MVSFCDFIGEERIDKLINQQDTVTIKRSDLLIGKFYIHSLLFGLIVG